MGQRSWLLQRDIRGNFETTVSIKFSAFSKTKMEREDVFQGRPRYRLQTRENSMTDLSVRCPETNKETKTGVASNYQSLTRLWNTEINVPCLHCGQSHTFLVRDAYMDQTDDDFRYKIA
jgi:hypothetical protein